MTKVLSAVAMLACLALIMVAGMSMGETLHRAQGRIEVADIDGQPAPEGLVCAYQRIGKKLLPVLDKSGRHVCVGESI
ncbi:MAG TPA: hypothetical protein VL027_02000 [Spongiibacteraceae bacterium]|nr:hypothetical protein [Spongiibacteraceae bacterium]